MMQYLGSTLCRLQALAWQAVQGLKGPGVADRPMNSSSMCEKACICRSDPGPQAQAKLCSQGQ